MTAGPGSVAVVILTWQSRPTIDACLQSLRDQLCPGDVVVVADNGSGDGTLAHVQRSHPWCEVVDNGANLGFAAGNNRVLTAVLARGFEFAFVLNPDTLVQPGALAALRAAAMAEPHGGAFQPLLLDAAVPTRIDSLGLRPKRSFGGADEGHGAPVPAALAARLIFGACGAAAFCRSEALRAAGLFDAGLFLLAEDLDLAFRLQLAGHGAMLVPDAKVLHRRGVSGRELDRAAARRRKHWLQRNTVALAVRYWPVARLLVGLPGLCWRTVQAIWCARANPGHGNLGLWWRFLRARPASRRAMRARGLDRWFS